MQILVAAQALEQGAVVAKSFCKSWRRVIRQAKLRSCFPDDFGQLAVMYVTDVGKQVVFDLVVQSTDKPGEQAVVRREIGSREHLVHSPGIFHIPFVVG